MKKISRDVLLIGLLFATLICNAEAIPSDTGAPVDQVVVEATREKLAKLEKEVQLAEQRFYERYNELNKKNDYAVKCANEAETGTRFKKTYCQPVFATKAREEQARRAVAYLQGTSTPASTSSAAAQMHAGATVGVQGMAGGANSQEDRVDLSAASSAVTGVPGIMAISGTESNFQKNMIELTRKNPELEKLLNKHAELKAEYEATLRTMNGLRARDAEKAAEPAR